MNQKGILLLGEIHGIRQNLDLIYKLFQDLGFTSLSLELPSILESSVKTYLSTGKEPNDPRLKHFTDGRYSVELLELLIKLKRDNSLNTLIFHDKSITTTEYTGWNARDYGMSQTFLKRYNPEEKTLVVGGNLHTRIKPFEQAGQTAYPMGYHLTSKLGKVPRMCTLYSKGSFFNFSKQRITSTVPTDRDKDEYKILVPIANPIRLLSFV